MNAYRFCSFLLVLGLTPGAAAAGPRDPMRNRYVATVSEMMQREHMSQPRRTTLQTVSDDLLHWGPKWIVLAADDRYVAREAGQLTATLRTPPVIVAGSAITLNAKIQDELKVRLVDASGQPLPGFDWVTLKGDKLDHAVAFPRSLDSLAGQPVRLEFRFRQAQLFGFDLQRETKTGPPRQAARQATPAGTDETSIKLGIGGCGGVYFLAEPGELTVDVEKRDRNRRGRRTDLRAILVGPDRKVLQDVTIPDDAMRPASDPGPPQRARLSTRVPRKGVYGLNITVSQDRYGDAIIWGFRTNCPRYLIETSRGHRDERHQEPIVLLNPDRPGDVCFLPRPGAFRVEVTDLPAGADALSVYDRRNMLVQTLRVEPGGRASGSFPADPRRGSSPWRLHLPAQQATVHIDGVTRWDREDLYPNLSLWTPDPASWFPFQEYRWILTPYSRLVYGRSGTQGEAAFRVHNSSDRAKTVKLAIEFPESPGSWPYWAESKNTRKRGIPEA